MKITHSRQIMMGLATALMLASMGTQSITNAQIQQFMTAMKQQNYTAAKNMVEPLAKQGDTGAQANLGVMYDGRPGVAQDYR